MKIKPWVRTLILMIDVIAVAFAFWYLLARSPGEPLGAYVRIYVVHSDGTEMAFSFQTKAITFGGALREGKVHVAEVDTEESGGKILSVDGETAPDGMAWHIELDGTDYGTDSERVPTLNRGKYRLVLQKTS